MVLLEIRFVRFQLHNVVEDILRITIPRSGSIINKTCVETACSAAISETRTAIVLASPITIASELSTRVTRTRDMPIAPEDVCPPVIPTIIC